MNAKELAELMRREAEISSKSYKQMILRSTARDIEKHLTPRYRPPQPSDDGKWCFLEELPSDAPPTLVQSYRPMKYCDESRAYEPDFESTRWRFWTAAGWRELTKGVWPCERPE